MAAAGAVEASPAAGVLGLLMNWPISAIRSIDPCVSVIVSPLLSGVGLPPGFIAMKVEPSNPSEVTEALVEQYEDAQLLALKAGLFVTAMIALGALAVTKRLPTEVPGLTMQDIAVAEGA